MVFATLSETPSKWPLHSTVPSLEIVIVDIAKAVTVQSLVPSENETKQWDLPESEGIFGAVVGVMLHIVEEAEEILQTLEADLITDRERGRDDGTRAWLCSALSRTGNERERKDR